MLFPGYKPKRKSLAAKVRKLKTLLAKKQLKAEKIKKKEALKKEYEALKKQLRLFREKGI